MGTFEMSSTAARAAGTGTSHSNTPASSAGPALTFNPGVAFAGPQDATLSGTVADPGGVASLEVYATSANSGPVDIGSAAVSPDGLWSIDDAIGSDMQSGIHAVESLADGTTSTVQSDFNLTAGIAGELYAAVQDSYDPATHAFTGQTFFAEDGSVVYTDTYTALSSYTAQYRYSDGSFFDGKAYTSFTDTYNTYPSGSTFQEEARDMRNGSHVAIVEVPHTQLASNYRDNIFNNEKGDTRFVFSRGYETDVVHGFIAQGYVHSTVDLPWGDFNGRPGVLGHTRDTAAGALITDPMSGDTILLANVSKAELAADRKLVAFHDPSVTRL